MESIEMKIAKKAALKWGQQEPQNLEEAKAITGGSEISSIKGIISVLGLNPELEKQMIKDVYTRDIISEEITKEIQTKFQRCGNNNAIIEMLSVVHDEWVKSNPNNFLKEGRNKEFQFVPLQMLSWEEAKSDLLFLKPILEAARIEVDEEAIKQQFEIVQKEFLIDNGIYSFESLNVKLKEGSKFYSALEGLETRNGGNIDELLKDDEISKKMAKQIESRIEIKSGIKMAQRELAEAAILPENFKGTPKTKVSSKSIIEAGQCLEKGLKTTEVGRIKGIFAKIIDKFKGKGEK